MMIAYCGLICDTCPIHLATLEQDDSRKQLMRISIAEQCSKIYGLNMQPEDVTDCDGCKAETGRLFSGCMNCEIRNCVKNRNLDGCAFCEAYACEKLGKHFDADPEAKRRLDKIRERTV